MSVAELRADADTRWSHAEALQWSFDAALRVARKAGYSRERSREIALDAVREAWFSAGWDNTCILAILDGPLDEYARKKCGE